MSFLRCHQRNVEKYIHNLLSQGYSEEYTEAQTWARFKRNVRMDYIRDQVVDINKEYQNAKFERPSDASVAQHH